MNTDELQEISQSELPERLSDPGCVLVDVREEVEFKDFNIGGINIPAHLVNENLSLLGEYHTLIIACSNGVRSHILTRIFRKKLPDKQILHLKEGIF